MKGTTATSLRRKSWLKQVCANSLVVPFSFVVSFCTFAVAPAAIFASPVFAAVEPKTEGAAANSEAMRVGAVKGGDTKSDYDDDDQGDLLRKDVDKINVLRPTVVGKSQLKERPKKPLFSALKVKEVSEGTRELADQLEILPMLHELYDETKIPSTERKLALRMKIQETIFECYFDAASVQAQASREGLQLQELRESLSSKRDHNVEVNNATNFIASGTLNTVGSILGFAAKTPPFSGNLNQMLSGVVAASMSTYALKQNNGGKIFTPNRPTVLAELFGRPVDDRTTYPESVWRFLHGNAPDFPGMTRLQVMEKAWIQHKHLEAHGSPREQIKLDMVCGVADPKHKMSIDDINDEITMVADVGTISELMTHHLRDLLRMIDSDVFE